MRCVTFVFFAFLPGAALAHVGHIAEVAGHGHWVAGAAIGLAVLVGIWGKMKDKDDAEPDPDDSEAEPEESAA